MDENVVVETPTTSENGRGHFVGGYVRDLVDLAVASSLAATHAIIIGGPGIGKTAISLASLRRMYNQDELCIIRFKPTTPSAKVDGVPNYTKLFKEDVFELVLDGTPYDPKVRAILADEFPRAREDALDSFLDVMDKIENKTSGDVDAPVVIATANFLPKDERSEATLDRFAMFMWLPNPHNDIESVSRNIMAGLGHNLEVEGDFPTMEDIARVRAMKPGQKSIDAVSKIVDDLFKAAEQGVTDSSGNVTRTFTLNYRLVEQMDKVLFRVSAWKYNTDDFDRVHPDAINTLKWMYKSKSYEESRDWALLVGTLADPTQAAIDRLMEDAYDALRDVAKTNSNKMTAAAKMATKIADKMAEASMIIPQDDPRMVEAMAVLQDAVANFTRTGKI